MISLTELLNTINKESKDGLINIEDWRWPDVDHLITMGFKVDDDFHMVADKNNQNTDSKIIIYKKKDDEIDKSKERQSYFYIEEKGRKIKRFKTFNDVIDYFDTYSQPEIDKNI